MLTPVLLALRFLVELAGIAAVAWWGFHSIDGPAAGILGIGAAAVLILAWGLWVAPRARFPQSPRFRLVVGTVILEATALALAAVGAHLAAAALAFTVAVDAIGLAAVGEGRPS